MSKFKLSQNTKTHNTYKLLQHQWFSPGSCSCVSLCRRTGQNLRSTHSRWCVWRCHFLPAARVRRRPRCCCFACWFLLRLDHFCPATWSTWWRRRENFQRCRSETELRPPSRLYSPWFELPEHLERRVLVLLHMQEKRIPLIGIKTKTNKKQKIHLTTFYKSYAN